MRGVSTGSGLHCRRGTLKWGFTTLTASMSKLALDGGKTLRHPSRLHVANPLRNRAAWRPGSEVVRASHSWRSQQGCAGLSGPVVDCPLTAAPNPKESDPSSTSSSPHKAFLDSSSSLQRRLPLYLRVHIAFTIFLLSQASDSPPDRQTRVYLHALNKVTCMSGKHT